MARILIVDDEPHMRQILAVLLAAGHDRVVEAGSVADAMAQLGSTSFDAVLTDYRLGDGDGLSVLTAAHEIDAALPVVMLTAYATIDTAVEAMRRGAFDFLTKPFQPDVVKATVHRAAERCRLLRENERLKGEVARLGAAGEILGSGAAMAAVREAIARVAPAGTTVLITGETGTGKELVAHAIHDASPRATGPFVAVNCAAFGEPLLESELFGHERGAFTGADRARPGLFETAHRGTLFLDEAGEMSLALQSKLLRVLVDRLVTRIGARKPIPVDVRVVAATHRDLPARIQEGLFRQDLYYRLAVFPIHVPALRERREDLETLIEHFVRRIALELKVTAPRVSPEAVELLASYEFPGNVRELRNLVERALILARGPSLDPRDFPVAGGTASPPVEGGEGDWLDAVPEPVDLRAWLAAAETAIIRRALRAANGVQAEAGRRLGLSRSDMTYKLRRLAIGTDS